MDRRLQRLQTRLTGLRELVAGGIPPDLDQILACEALVSELREEHEALQKELSSASTPAMRKLAKDFTRLTPVALETLRIANQACFDARFAVEAQNRNANQKNDEKMQAKPSTEPSASESTSSKVISDRKDPRQQRLQMQVSKEDEAYSQEVAKEMKAIEDKAESVRALTANVAMMVAHQADDVAHIEEQTSSARDDVVAGLGELAEAKKKEAGKHTTRSTTVSAVIGGAVGLVGGPIGIAFGAAAGAAFGAAIGSSITSLSRRSIDREIRAFKEKFRVEIRADGSCFTHAQVYENERWSLGRKMWSSDNLLPTDFRMKWTLDEIGNPIGPNDPSPINPEAFPKPPVMNTDQKGPNRPVDSARAQMPKPPNTDGLEYEDEQTIVDEEIEGNNSTFAGSWRWAQNSRWMPDMSERNADANGWQYSFSFGDGNVWYSEPNRTSFVRRRRWTRVQILDPQKAHHPERIALIVMARKRAEADSRVQRTLQPSLPVNEDASRSLNNATRSLGQSVQASHAVLEELRNQGMQIHDAALDVAIAEDASVHAQRVARAVTMSGVFRNAFSSAPDATETVALRRDRDLTRINKNTIPSAIPASSFGGESKVGWEQPIDTLEKLCDEQLQMSNVIHKEVNVQNKQLDLLTEATTRGERRIMRAKDMI